MRRWWIVVALAACSSRENRALERCARGLIALGETVRAAGSSVRFNMVPDLSDVACADLYREPACAAAWRDAFTPGDAEVLASTIEAACAAAYCAKLPVTPACTHAPDGSGLRALDTAILKFEGLDDETARTIARRAAVFTEARVKRTNAPVPAPATTTSLVMTVDVAGQLAVDGKAIERAELPRVFQTLAAEHGQLVIEARPGTSHGVVVDLMEQAKRAGVTRLAIGTAK